MPFKHDIKIYQINTNFYEFREKETTVEVVDSIIEYHKANFKSDYDVEHKESEFEIGDVSYRLYSFDEIEKESAWMSYLPSELTEDNDFKVRHASFCLFIEYDSRVFSIIGGKGISVIKRFLNHTFGLDFFEKIAEPENDIVHTLLSRGVTGNLTSEEKTYRNDQKLGDALSIGRVPRKIHLELRKELKDTIFDFVDFEKSDTVHIEIGNIFRLKWKLSFEETHLLILRISEVLDSDVNSPLSSFERIRDDKFEDEILKMALYTHLRDDMVRLNTGDSTSANLLDYDFVHPDKLTAFYECDEYQIFLKGAQIPFETVQDRSLIYSKTLAHIYSIVDPKNPWDFISKIAGVRVKGFVGESQKTIAMFTNHLTCEILVSGRPYFLIDNNWYSVRGDFIKAINDRCKSILQSNRIQSEILSIPWSINEMTEGDYNLAYNDQINYIVLDKMLGQNIELCDILYEDGDQIYLIHVKKGFDAKIRDLTNQISISANRLWNDVKSDFHFVDAVYDRYKRSSHFNNDKTLEEFRDLFSSQKEVIFVLAFAHNKINKSVYSDLEDFKSNIAKFSVVQIQQDIQNTGYQLRIGEIKNMHNIS